LKRLWQDIKKFHRLLIAGVTLVVISRWVYARGLPERLMEVTAPIQDIRNGKIYMLRRSYDRADFQMCPIDRPVEQRLASETLNNNQVAGITVADTGIYYVLQPRGFAQTPHTLPGARQTPSSNTKPHFRFRWIPLEGGEPREIPAGIAQPNPIIAGNSIYWLEPDTFLPNGRPATNRLMSAPLSGGPSTALFKGLPRRVQLGASSTGVFWIAPAKDDPKYKTLFHMAAGDTKPREISPYTGMRAPIEMEGRLYWVEETRNDTHSALELVSALPDGSDRQSVYRRATFMLRDGSGLGERISRIIPHKDKLYFLAIRAEDRTSSDTTQPAELYCVDAGPGKVARSVRKFDNVYDRYVFIDGDYYYFAIVELQEESIFSFSKDGLFIKRQPVLYRYRLPG
jgi:hypothetical protein